MRQTHTFVLKVLLDQENLSLLRGQISEPSSADEWRANFVDLDDLLQQLLGRIAIASGEGDARWIPIADRAEIERVLKRVEIHS